MHWVNGQGIGLAFLCYSTKNDLNLLVIYNPDTLMKQVLALTQDMCFMATTDSVCLYIISAVISPYRHGDMH